MVKSIRYNSRVKYKLFDNLICLTKKLNPQIPSWQRFIDQESIDRLVESMKKNVEFTTPIVLCTFEDRTVIIDGQHRFHAMKKLVEDGKIFPVMCSIVKVKSEQEALQVWHDVNRRFPHDPSENMDSYQQAMQITKRLIFMYPKVFKDSRNCHRPHINRSKLCERLSHVIEKENAFDSDDFIEKCQQFNQYLSKLSVRILWDSYRVKKSDSKNMFEKLQKDCENKNCFLGIVSDYKWIEEVLNYKPRNGFLSIFS